MKIERTLVPEMTIEEFAEKHDLTMEIHERSEPPLVNPHQSWRFYACFKHADVKDGSVPIGRFGNGATEANAIADYASKISLKLLVVDARGPNQREIKVPRLVAAVGTQPAS